MSSTVSQDSGRLCLVRFEPRYASQIAEWVETDEQLRWVAPSARPPLTAAKVAAWKRPSGEAFTILRESDGQAVGYGELNPMQREPGHLWLGHLIVRPDQRGKGAGQVLVRALLAYASERYLATRVSLIVFPDNAAALKCYRRVGFTIVGEEYHQFGGVGPRHRLLRLEIDPTHTTPDRQRATQRP